MKFTKQDLLVALIFFVTFQLLSAVMWFAFDDNYFVAMLCGSIGAYSVVLYSKKSKV